MLAAQACSQSAMQKDKHTVVNNVYTVYVPNLFLFSCRLKRATLTPCFHKKGELKSNPLLDGKKGKGQPAREKAPRIKKKELFTLTPGDDAEN
jgi:hypothetical protein